MGTFISLIIFILLLVLTAFFVATEFAIVKVRTSRINSLANGDNKKAVAAQKVVSHLDEYLAACQLGITITALGIGMVGESTFEFLLHPIFSSLGLSETMIHIFTLISAFVIATYLHVVVGEMAPKTIAIQKAEQITLLIAKPIIMFYKLFYPFIYILNGSARLILKMFGMQPAKESELYHSEEELKLLIKESHEGGEISENELTHINRAFAFDEMKIADGYLPLEKVSVVDINSNIDETKAYVSNANYTRFPVIKDNTTQIVGYIHAKDLLSNDINSLKDITHRILKIKLNSKYHQVLEQMKSHQIHIALVEDEHQNPLGIITMENILENIVGDIKDEYDQS
ncbi:hemolysin family protein [Staphylococcus pseudoxylosus]|uniref:hemolysin family protein n=1 Tax=Staphylococcus pseudoxylosus TaxID=2282419 RepID=UPI000D1F094A|nr:hemolysin family protein [Staphylococcus pseudoxylosus]PTI54453.1 HlyC/CorC family transporter [Staphylococcus xylosus]MDW8799300.1 hemolysin family protein [Staphylococcus pseudoxylosus]MEB6037468.1 hemolysin family protein [Staphylococcus pseudoxylosus]MEB7764047.1 hemolysin family protein [Staphylococcus pseudoxylosus]MEB8087353.1 hemolysin family protein [Staphylococcus pseudoxylosus]